MEKQHDSVGTAVAPRNEIPLIPILISPAILSPCPTIYELSSGLLATSPELLRDPAVRRGVAVCFSPLSFFPLFFRDIVLDSDNISKNY